MKTFGDEIVKTTPLYRAYKKWFEEALDNSKFIYYRGISLTETNLSFVLGKVILQDAYKGEVLLFQKRLTKGMYGKDGSFEYIAVRRRKSPRRLVPNKLIPVELH